jgi:hypothetical protein
LQIDDEGDHVQAYDVNVDAEHEFAVLERLLAQAERSGYAMEEVNSFYFVDCMDLRDCMDLSFRAEVRKNLEEDRKQRIRKWLQEGDYTISQASVGYLTFTPLIAPFSIFPLPERTCLELMIATKIYRVTTNVGAIARAFKRRGWGVVPLKEWVQKKAENDPEDPISRADGPLVLQKDGVTMSLHVNELRRMSMELRPQVVIKVFDKMLSGAHPGNTRKYFEYKLNESHIWR